MAENWGKLVVNCEGGLVQSLETLRQGTDFVGTAAVLDNLEPSLDGGYRRIAGYNKFDSSIVPGYGAILGVGVFGDSALAYRNNYGNILLRSEELGNAYWSVTASCSITTNATTSPRGDTTADKFVENGVLGVKSLATTSTVTIDADTTYTFSGYFKADGRTEGRLRIVSGATSFGVFFDLTAGTVTAPTQLSGSGSTLTSSSISNVGNGWYRVAFTGKIDAISTTITPQLSLAVPTQTVSYTGDSTSGMFVWGMKLEKSSTLTGYIPTTSAAITGNSYQIFKSEGSGWGIPLNIDNRANSVVKARFIRYVFSTDITVLIDGANPAWRYTSSSQQLINGTGAPTAPTTGTYWKARLVLAQDDLVYISAANRDTVFDGSQGALALNVGDTVYSVYNFRDVLYIFCKDSIWKLVGDTSANFQLLPVSKKIGCLDGDTVQEVGGDLIYLSTDGLRSVAGTERNDDVELALYSRNIQKTIRSFISSYGRNNYSSVYIRRKNQYRLFTYDSTVSDSAQKGVLGTFKDKGYEWATITGFPAYCAADGNEDTNEIVVIGHASNGYVYRLEQGNSFDSNNIVFTYWTPYLTFGDAQIRKVFREINLYLDVEGLINFDLSLILDRDDPNVPQPAPITFTSTTAGVAVYGTAKYGTDVYSTISTPKLRELLIGSGFTGQFRFTGASNTTASFKINSFEIELAGKGRR